MNSDNKLRIAVRKFGPFESALEKIWKIYCEETGCRTAVEMVPLELPELHEEIIGREGLKNGSWDIAHVVTDWLHEAYSSGSLLDLKPFIRINPPEDFPGGWSSSLLNMQQFGDEIGGLPFHDGPECLIYRKDLFEDPAEKDRFRKEYGRALQPPATWEEFREVATYFHRPESGFYGSIFACYPDGHNAVFDFCLQLWTRGGSLIAEDGSIDINTPEALEGLTFYKEIVNNAKAVHPASAGFESVQAGMAFARGEAAMMINWFGFASMCEVYSGSKVKGKVNIAGIPRGAKGSETSLNVYWLYAVGAGSRHKELAYDFIRFATSRKNDKLLTLEGGIGCRISTWTDPQVNELVPYYNKLEMLHEVARTLPKSGNWAKVAEIIDRVVTEAVKSDKPVAGLLREGQMQISLTDT